MFSIFGTKPAAATAAAPACPVKSGTRVVEKMDYVRVFECYADLKRKKAGDSRLNDLFGLVDATRTKWDAYVESALSMNTDDADRYAKSVEDDTNFAGKAIDTSPLLSREEKYTAHQFLYASMRQAEHAVRDARRVAGRSSKLALKVDEAAGRALTEREAAASAASLAAATAGVGSKSNANAAVRTARLATRRAERAEERVSKLFGANATRRTNASLAAYAAPAAASTGAGTAVPARAPVSGVRIAPTGAPGEYAGGRRKTLRTKNRKARKSRRTHRR
jgi:hypothetical protein